MEDQKSIQLVYIEYSWHNKIMTLLIKLKRFVRVGEKFIY